MPNQPTREAREVIRGAANKFDASGYPPDDREDEATQAATRCANDMRAYWCDTIGEDYTEVLEYAKVAFIASANADEED